MCIECADKLLGVDKLLSEVRRVIGELRRLLRRCKEQGSCRQFVRTLHNLGLDGGVVADTMEFLGEFRSRIAGVQADEEGSTGEDDPLVIVDINDDPELKIHTSRIEPRVEEEEEVAISQNPTTSLPWTSDSVKTADPLAIDDYNGDSDFEADDDNDDDDGDHDYSYDNESSTEEDEDEDYIPSRSKRAKFDNNSKTLSRRQQQNKSIPKQKPSTHQIPQTFETDYVKDEEVEWLMPDDNSSRVEPDPLSTPQPTSTSSFRFTSGGSVTTQQSTMSVYPAVPTVSSVITANEEMEHVVGHSGHHLEGRKAAMKLKSHQIIPHNPHAGDEIPKSDSRLKVKIPPGASSSVKKDEAGKPLYLTVNPPADDKSLFKKYYICLVDNCGYQFEGYSSLRNLQDHQIKHRENMGKPIQAWSFTKEFVPGTKKHKTVLKCELCFKGRRFKHPSELKKHLKEKHNVDPGDITIFQKSDNVQTCELCKIKLPRKELLEHVKGHVGEEYTVRCPNKECWYVCVTQYRLWSHLKKADECLEKAGFGKDVEEFKKKQRTCTICGFTAKNLLVLRYHLLEEHETSEKNYPCPFSGCGMKFTLRESVMLHLSLHEISREGDTQSCLECGDKKQVKLEEMEAHLKKEHGISEVVKCLRCPFLFASREQLVDHMFLHRHGEMVCDVCGYAGERFLKYSNLVEHYFTQHQIGSKLQCEHCPNWYWIRDSLNAHLNNHHKNIPKKVTKPTFKCADCERVFKTKDGLISHRIKLHGDPPLSCKYCSATFDSKVEQLQHEKVVHKGMPKPPNEFPCLEPNCGKVFKTKYQLNYHHKYAHKCEKGSHICEICGKDFTNSTGLRIHIDAVHLGLRNHICDVCGESFGSGTVLKKHKMIHTGERPFSCEICNQRFRHKEVLQRHLASHQEKGADFKPNGPMKQARARVKLKRKGESQ